MKNKLDIFESAIKNTIEKHEAPYDANAWKSISSKLGKASKPFYQNNWFRAGAGIVTIAVISLLVNWNNLEEPSDNKLTEVINPVSEIKSENPILDSNIPKENIIEKETNEITWVVSEKGMFPEAKKEIENVVESETVNTPKDIIVEAEEIKEKANEKIIVNEIIKKDESKLDKKVEIIADFNLEESICQNTKIHLIANHFSENVRYSWKINGLEEIKVESLSLVLDNKGLNKITLLIKDEKGKLLNKITKEIFVKELPLNEVLIKLDENSIINKYDFELLNFENKIIWNFGDNESKEEYSTSHTYRGKNSYKCNYTITNKEGCSTTFEKGIKVRGYYNFKTNYAFTPNGDGDNDGFVPAELQFINQPFEMVIQDKFGAFLYKTNSINLPWDGNDRNGIKILFGTYVWTVTLINEFGKDEIYQGTVTNVKQ